MADMKKLIPGAIALVVLAAITLMGMAVVEGFSEEFRDDSGTANMTMTLGAVNVSTRIGTSEQYPYVETVTDCTNDTLDLGSGNFTFDEADSVVDGGYLTLLDSGVGWVGDQVNCTGTYKQDSTLQGHADKFGTGLAIFGSFMAVLVIARRKKED